MTVLDIYNLALASLAHDRILTSTTEDAQEATRCNLFYPRARLDVFTRHPWRFLQVHDTAVRHTTYPAIAPYQYVYAAPTDALILCDAIATDGERANFLQRGGLLYTSIEIDTIVYTQDNDNPEEWPEPIKAAVVAALAIKLAVPMAASPKTIQSAMMNLQEAIADAQRHDARTHERTSSPHPATAATSPYRNARA